FGLVCRVANLTSVYAQRKGNETSRQRASPSCPGPAQIPSEHGNRVCLAVHGGTPGALAPGAVRRRALVAGDPMDVRTALALPIASSDPGPGHGTGPAAAVGGLALRRGVRPGAGDGLLLAVANGVRGRRAGVASPGADL